MILIHIIHNIIDGVLARVGECGERGIITMTNICGIPEVCTRPIVHRCGLCFHIRFLGLAVVGQRADLLDGNIGEHGLVDRNGHLAGCGGVFRRVRGEDPLGFIFALVAHIGLDRAVLPRERAGDFRAGGRVVPHRAVECDRAVGQRLAVGDGAGAHRAVQLRDDLVSRKNRNRQGDILVVGGIDRNAHGADVAFRGNGVLLDLQGQRVVPKDISRAVGVRQIDIRCSIADITIRSGTGQRRHERRQIDIIVLCQIVGNIQLQLGRLRWCGSPVDGTAALLVRPIRQRVVLYAGFEGDIGSDGLIRSGVRVRKRTAGGVIRAAGQRVAALQAVERHAGDGGRSSAVVDLVRHRHARDRQFLRLDGDGNAPGGGIVVVAVARYLVVHGVGARVDGCGNGVGELAAVTQTVLHGAAAGCTGGDQRLFAAVVGQGVGNGVGHNAGSRLVDLDRHLTGCRRVFRCIRGEYPLSVIAARVGLDRIVLPREGARNHGLCAGANHRTRGCEHALCQRLAVSDLRRADGNARLIELDFCTNEDLDGKLEPLIVRGHNRDGYRTDLRVNICGVRGHGGQSQNAFF